MTVVNIKEINLSHNGLEFVVKGRIKPSIKIHQTTYGRGRHRLIAVLYDKTSSIKVLAFDEDADYFKQYLQDFALISIEKPVIRTINEKYIVTNHQFELKLTQFGTKITKLSEEDDEKFPICRNIQLSCLHILRPRSFVDVTGECIGVGEFEMTHNRSAPRVVTIRDKDQSEIKVSFWAEQAHTTLPLRSVLKIYNGMTDIYKGDVILHVGPYSTVVVRPPPLKSWHTPSSSGTKIQHVNKVAPMIQTTSRHHKNEKVGVSESHKNSSSNNTKKKLYETQTELDFILIRAVRKNPALWDTRLNKEDRNQEKRRELWKLIQTEIGDNYEVTAIKSRWTDLRKQYVAKLRKCSLEGGSVSTWKYFDKLRFLDDVLDDRIKNASNLITHSIPEQRPPVSVSSSTSHKRKEPIDNKEDLRSKKSRMLENVFNESIEELKSKKSKILETLSIIEKEELNAKNPEPPENSSTHGKQELKSEKIKPSKNPSADDKEESKSKKLKSPDMVVVEKEDSTSLTPQTIENVAANMQELFTPDVSQNSNNPVVVVKEEFNPNELPTLENDIVSIKKEIMPEIPQTTPENPAVTVKEEIKPEIIQTPEDDVIVIEDDLPPTRLQTPENAVVTIKEEIAPQVLQAPKNEIITIEDDFTPEMSNTPMLEVLPNLPPKNVDLSENSPAADKQFTEYLKQLTQGLPRDFQEQLELKILELVHAEKVKYNDSKRLFKIKLG